jgi:AraC-like DNA-binding protein
MAEEKFVIFKGLPVERPIVIEKIASVLFYRYSPSFVFKGEKHSDWEFVYVDKGQVLIEADGQPFSLHDGEFFLHKPMQFHKIKSDGVSSDVFIMAFTLSSGGSDLLKLTDRVVTANESARSVLTRIMEEKKLVYPATNFFADKIEYKNEYGSLQYVANLLENFFILSLRGSQDASASEEIQKGNAIVNSAISYLSDHLGDNIKFSDLSSHLGYSESYIAKLFRNVLHTSVKEYQINLKIEKAKILIVEKKLSFSEIAYQLGFSSVQHFSKMFKEKTCYSPSSYQKSVFMKNLYDPFTAV